ncbi:MAG: hypothetical protein P8M22_08265 [Phycisphaerales bacterium]|nr:hypothetical protein [Phycisphaerales bacterium]
MNTKKTSWINILAAPIIVAGFGLAGSTTVADHCYPTDVNESGQVNIDDLLLVIEDWGEECDLDEHDLLPSDLEWSLTEWVSNNPDLPGNQPCTNNCLGPQFCQSSDHRTVGMPNMGASSPGNNMHVMPKYLYRGPSHVSDQLKIGVTVDVRSMRNNDNSVSATPALFLIGYGDGTGSATIPKNTNAAGDTWYYADKYDPAKCGDNKNKTAELDLFEMGYANVSDTYNGDVNLMQITSHGSGDTDQGGTYIGLQQWDLNALAGGDGYCSTNNCNSQLVYATKPDGSTSNALGLDISQTFHMEYTIFQGGMDIVITQEGTTFDGPQTVKFRGESGRGVDSFLDYQYFGLVVSINNGYKPAKWNCYQNCEITPHADPSYDPGNYKVTFDTIAMLEGQADDPDWTACEALTDYVGGINDPNSTIPTPDHGPPYSIPVGCNAGYPYPTCD